MQTEREIPLRGRPVPGETVDDTSLGPRLALEDVRRVGVRLARVDHDGFLQRLRQPHLGGEQFTLHFPRRSIVVVVETALAYRQAVGLAADRFQLAQVVGAGAPDVVRMDAGGGAEKGTIGASKFEGVARRGHAAA